MSFHFDFRVYYEDTDASGVMYHARYLAFFERARTEYLRAAGFDQEYLMRAHDIAFTLSDLGVRYRRPARLDDELRVGVQVERLGAASVVFLQSMHRRADGEHLAEARVRAGCVRFSDFSATRMPEALRQALHQQRIAHVL